MRQTKRQKVSLRSNEEQWYLDKADCLSFQEYIELFNYRIISTVSMLSIDLNTFWTNISRPKALMTTPRSKRTTTKFGGHRLIIYDTGNHDRICSSSCRKFHGQAHSEIINTTTASKIESLKAAATSFTSGTASESHNTANNAIASNHPSATTTTESHTTAYKTGHTTAYNDITGQSTPTAAAASHSATTEASVNRTSPTAASVSHTTSSSATSTEHNNNATKLGLENNIVTISRRPTIYDDPIGKTIDDIHIENICGNV